MTDEFGAAPRGGPRSGWAISVCELCVEDLATSLAFWRDLLGFEIAYQRPAEGFVYLEHPEGHQIMLCSRNGWFETGPIERPHGRGVMFQFYFATMEPQLAALTAAGWPAYRAYREIWRRTGDCESGQREIWVQDPDGYLVMVAQNIGSRPPQSGT